MLQILRYLFITMAQKLNKHVLDWIGKEEESTPLEPRILLDSPKHSYKYIESGPLTNEKSCPSNIDILIALRNLELNFTSAVKCIYPSDYIISKSNLLFHNYEFLELFMQYVCVWPIVRVSRYKIKTIC